MGMTLHQDGFEGAIGYSPFFRRDCRGRLAIFSGMAFFPLFGAGTFFAYFYSLSTFLIFFYFWMIGAALLSRLWLLLLLARLISRFFFFLFRLVPYSMMAESVAFALTGTGYGSCSG